MSCWHKLFCEGEGVSHPVSVFVLIESYYFALGGVATEEYCTARKRSHFCRQQTYVLPSSLLLLIDS